MLNFPIKQTNGSAAKSKSCKVVPQAGCCKDGEFAIIVKIDLQQNDYPWMLKKKKTNLHSRLKFTTL